MEAHSLSDVPLSKDQLIQLVRKLQRGEGSSEEVSFWLDLFERSVPYPGVVSLIYWSQEELNAEEIVERALAYQPIPLGPPTEDPPYYYGPPPRL